MNPIPKDLVYLLYGQVAHAKRPRGWPKWRYKDCYKRDMKYFDISSDNWEKMAHHRKTWKSKLRAGSEHYDHELRRKSEAKATRTQPA